MKYKKIYILILLIVFLIFIIYFLHVNKTEAPKDGDKFTVKGTTEIQNILDKKNEIKETATEKYKITGRTTVTPENIINNKKIILLTIDDGPGPRTKEMISILEKHKAKAIFFINGMHDKGYPGIIEYIAQEGFAVGNHTWSHANLKKEKDINIAENEIKKDTDLIKKLTGNPPRFFRAPYGESTASIRKYIKDNGMIFMDWSGAALDWEKSTIEKDIFVGNVMKNIHSGSIILIHEHPWSVANLDALLNTIESKGYTYVDPKDIIE